MSRMPEGAEVLNSISFTFNRDISAPDLEAALNSQVKVIVNGTVIADPILHTLPVNSTFAGPRVSVVLAYRVKEGDEVTAVIETQIGYRTTEGTIDILAEMDVSGSLEIDTSPPGRTLSTRREVLCRLRPNPKKF